MSTAAERSVAAEARGVEEGHRAFVQPGGWVRVKSDTFEGKWFRVDVLPAKPGERLVFLCQPEGVHAYTEDHLVRSVEAGALGCKHVGLAARRLEREGRALFDGNYWTATKKGVDLAKVEHVGSVITKAEGALSNFDVVCSCGLTCGIATTDRAYAEKYLADHIEAHNPDRPIDLFAIFGGG